MKPSSSTGGSRKSHSLARGGFGSFGADPHGEKTKGAMLNLFLRQRNTTGLFLLKKIREVPVLSD
jgi:hypothetical protein